MALILKNPEYKISIDGSKIYVKDVTGAYDATTNPNGYGAPNAELNETALVCIIQRMASTGEELFEAINPVNPYVFDNTALNTKETEFEFNFAMDGVMDISIIALRVSMDGETYLDDDSGISEGEYFYWDGGIYKMETPTPDEIENSDLAELFEWDDLVYKTCSDILAPKLALKRQDLRRKYMVQRKKDVDDAEPLFQEGLKLAEDIRGAYYTFYANMKVEAQNQIEQLLKLYELI